MYCIYDISDMYFIVYIYIYFSFQKRYSMYDILHIKHYILCFISHSIDYILDTIYIVYYIFYFVF